MTKTDGRVMPLMRPRAGPHRTAVAQQSHSRRARARTAVLLVAAVHVVLLLPAPPACSSCSARCVSRVEARDRRSPLRPVVATCSESG
jgi:hypothetical protein